MAVMQASEANINFVKTRLASPDGKLWGSKPGMVLIKPTSISHSGTSATLGENGQVTFNAVTSLSLNGCFTADFDNYFLSMRYTFSSGSNYLLAQFMSSGISASGSHYADQYLFSYGTTVTAARRTAETSQRLYVLASDSPLDAFSAYFYGPFLAQPTTTRSTGLYSYQNASTFDISCTHSLSTSYDGAKLFPASGNMTGALQVYGVRS